MNVTSEGGENAFGQLGPGAPAQTPPHLLLTPNLSRVEVRENLELVQD